MFIVTGGAGFIGSNIVRGLNQRGINDVLVVDNLQRSEKFLNIRDCQIRDYVDKREFRRVLRDNELFGQIEAIFHQGACSDTMEHDGQYMMDNNYAYSKDVLEFALFRQIPFVYASSAATYGDSKVFSEQPANERPLNIYGYSKLLFDNHVRRVAVEAKSTVVGLRYFNVYGQHEAHKSRMASTAHQFALQLRQTGAVRLFEGIDGYADGEQRRDFICVSDVVDVNFHFAFGSKRTGVFNVGTGKSRSFNDVARALIALRGEGRIEYIPFPESLKGKYQSFTEADITALRATGYTRAFTSLEDGIAQSGFVSASPSATR